LGTPLILAPGSSPSPLPDAPVQAHLSCLAPQTKAGEAEPGPAETASQFTPEGALRHGDTIPDKIQGIKISAALSRLLYTKPGAACGPEEAADV